MFLLGLIVGVAITGFVCWCVIYAMSQEIKILRISIDELWKRLRYEVGNKYRDKVIEETF